MYKRQVNGKALSSNITLDADDVGAVPIVSPATAGHLAALTAGGGLTDSGVVAENVAALLSPSPWIYPTIQHATDPGPGFQVRYTKTGNIVSLAGSFETWDAGEAIFTLPEGYRPLGIWAFPGFDNSKDPDTVQQTVSYTHLSRGMSPTPRSVRRWFSRCWTPLDVWTFW